MLKLLTVSDSDKVGIYTIGDATLISLECNSYKALVLT